MNVVVVGSLPKAFGLTRAALKVAATSFAMRSSKRVGGVWREIVVNLVHDAESDAAHRAIMDVAGATDVITQAYDAMPGEPEGLYGELIVNVDQAMRACPARWPKAKELLLYVAHGMDHLSGADDHAERDYRTMRRRELAWLRQVTS